MAFGNRRGITDVVFAAARARFCSNCAFSSGSSTSMPGGTGRAGMPASKTVSVEVMATLRSMSVRMSVWNGAPFGSTSAMVC